MKKFVSFVLSFFLICNVFADTESSRSANRKTALRYLQLAKHYITGQNWESALKSCVTGIEYDDTVADLYYLYSLSLFNLNYTRSEFIPVIEIALDSSKTQWVDYNQSNARIFYSDLLCTTGKPEQAITVLDSEPMIFSADAEFIRAKAYYEINSAESILKAEQKIESARRVYPDDARFVYLFFGYEYNLLYEENEDKTGFVKKELSPVARKIADSFIARVPNYDKEHSDLEIYASIFADGETQKRLLKAFDARGFKNILYPIAALEAGVINQEEAVDYFMEFIDGEIDEKILIQFYSMITDEDLRKYFNEHLDAFNGTLVYDTNNNLEANLVVKYERGRAKQITYDAENDQCIEWEADCDFGMPKEMTVYDQNAIIKFGTYPNVSTVIFKNANNGNPDDYELYNIIDETYQSKAFKIINAPQVKGTDFFVVDTSTLQHGQKLFAEGDIVKSSNTVERPSQEKPGAKILFSLLNGQAYSAVYSADGRVYATALFNLEGDVCATRNVDYDGDLIYEVTEYYAIDDGKMHLSDKDKAAITTNLWGSPLLDAGIYLKTVKIDSNVDTKIDYEIEYYPDGGTVIRSDEDFDGNFDCVYKSYSRVDAKPLKEENSYKILDLNGEQVWVSVITEDKIPVIVKKGEEEIKVVPGKKKGVYWLDSAWEAAYENEMLLELEGIPQGHVIQSEYEGSYIRAVIFGRDVFLKRVEREIKNENSLDGEEN